MKAQMACLLPRTEDDRLLHFHRFKERCLQHFVHMGNFHKLHAFPNDLFDFHQVAMVFFRQKDSVYLITTSRQNFFFETTDGQYLPR